MKIVTNQNENERHTLLVLHDEKGNAHEIIESVTMLISDRINQLRGEGTPEGNLLERYGFMEENHCKECGGTGYIESTPCEVCNGDTDK